MAAPCIRITDVDTFREINKPDLYSYIHQLHTYLDPRGARESLDILRRYSRARKEESIGFGGAVHTRNILFNRVIAARYIFISPPFAYRRSNTSFNYQSK